MAIIITVSLHGFASGNTSIVLVVVFGAKAKCQAINRCKRLCLSCALFHGIELNFSIQNQILIDLINTKKNGGGK